MSFRRTILRTYEATPAARGDWQFSDPALVHITPETGGLRLRLDAGQDIEAAGIYARTPELHPAAVRQWLGARVDAALPAGTSLGYRVQNGSVDFWWDGAAWSAPDAGEWNTLTELVTHLGTFPVTSRKLRIVVNLVTTDYHVTPVVSAVVVGFEADVPSWDEEYLTRTLLRALKAGLHPIADLAMVWPGGDTANVSAALASQEEPCGEGWVGVVAAYDFAADPDLTDDLLADYDDGALTLTRDVDEDADLVLRVEYRPAVALTTHPDYDELPAVPAVVLEVKAEPASDTEVVDHILTGAATGLSVRAPRVVTYQIDVRCMASRQLDLHRLGDAVECFLRGSPVIRSPSTGIEIGIDVTAPFAPGGQPNNSAHLNEGRIAVNVTAAERWVYPASVVHTVRRVVVAGNGNLQVTVE